MDRFLDGSEDASATTAEGASGDPSDLSTLYRYPLLGSLFKQPDSPQLREMRERFGRSTQALERIVRHGTKQEAEAAGRALRAYETVLGLFEDLQKLQRETGKTG